MQELLNRVAQDARLRGRSEGTVYNYTRNVKHYLDFLGDLNLAQTSEKDIKAYCIYLREKRKLKESTIDCYLSAVVFLYEVTLNRELNKRQIPFVKKPKHLPAVLTNNEIHQILNATNTSRELAFLSLGYGSGLRASEVVRLRVRDIDSQNMRVFIHEGKGKKDRYTILSQLSLNTLRKYWSIWKPRSKEGYLFPTHDGSGPIDSAIVSKTFTKVISRTHIQNKELYRFHTLRHCFATHMLEAGVSLVTIKEYLGHSSFNSTCIYLHLAVNTADIVSPIDSLEKKSILW